MIHTHQSYQTNLITLIIAWFKIFVRSGAKRPPSPTHPPPSTLCTSAASYRIITTLASSTTHHFYNPDQPQCSVGPSIPPHKRTGLLGFNGPHKRRPLHPIRALRQQSHIRYWSRPRPFFLWWKFYWRRGDHLRLATDAKTTQIRNVIRRRWIPRVRFPIRCQQKKQ